MSSKQWGQLRLMGISFWRCVLTNQSIRQLRHHRGGTWMFALNYMEIHLIFVEMLAHLKPEMSTCWHQRKHQGIPKVGGLHHLETVNICSKCGANPSCRCWDISLEVKNDTLSTVHFSVPFRNKDNSSQATNQNVCPKRLYCTISTAHST